MLLTVGPVEVEQLDPFEFEPLALQGLAPSPIILDYLSISSGLQQLLTLLSHVTTYHRMCFCESLY